MPRRRLPDASQGLLNRLWFCIAELSFAMLNECIGYLDFCKFNQLF